MSDRYTVRDLETRVISLNRRMAEKGSVYRYEYRKSVRYSLVRIRVDDDYRKITEHDVIFGTKAELCHYLHVMMVVLDDVEMKD